MSRRGVALRDVGSPSAGMGTSGTAPAIGTGLGPTGAVVRAQLVAVALVLSALTACGMYGRVIPRRPPTGTDLNRASVEEIADLPGLSEADAERIIGNRPYTAKDDLVRRGVLTEERFQAIQDRVYLGRPATETTGPPV